MSQTETTPGTVPDPERTGEDRDESVTAAEIEELTDQQRPTEAALTKDDIFGLLKNSRRREVTRYLLDSDDGATLDELAEHIAAKENDIPIKHLSSDQRKRVYIGLYQCHLPKMDKVGVIDYNKNRGTIEARQALHQLEPYLADDSSSESPEVELVVALAIGIAVVLGVAGIWPLGILPATAWALVSVVGLIGVAGLHQYRSDYSMT